MRTSFFLILSFIWSIKLSAQNPATTFEIPNRTIDLPCGINDTSIVAIVPDVRQSNSYVITTALYRPFPWVSAAGIDVTAVIPGTTNDDMWTPVINFFPFCYFGSNFSSLLVGTNSAITFDLSKQGSGSDWRIPINGAIPAAHPGYEPNMIFGPYHDIDIDKSGSNKRIEYRIEGLPPKRRFIVSFNEVPYFDANCGGYFATHQMVLYEGTGIVEIYIKEKPPCTQESWNAGRSILGMQDGTRTRAAAVTGRNATVWGGVNMNECWRFVPSAGAPNFLAATLELSNGTVVSNAVTNTVAPGKLELKFPGISPTSASTKYYLKLRYKNCSDPSTEILFTDSVVVNKLPGTLTAAPTVVQATACGSSNGSITINNVMGGTTPYEYSINNGVGWQLSNTFSGLAQGSYTINIRDGSGFCSLTRTVTVGVSGFLPATTGRQPASCTGVNNGSITINSVGGTGPFQISLNGAAPVAIPSIPHTIPNLAQGPYTIRVIDQSNGCTTDLISETITTGIGVDATFARTPTSCPTVNNGSITVTPTFGVAPFSLGINGAPPQPQTFPYTFSNLAATMHPITIRDALGCTRTFNEIVAPGPPLSATVNGIAPSCQGASNGTLTVTPGSGTAPFTYSLNSGAFLPGPSPNIITNLPANNYTVVVKDAAGCLTNILNGIIQPGAPLVTTATKTDALCNGTSTGSITVVQPTAGTAPYEYSLDNNSWQSNNQFNGLPAGNYTAYFRESNGCFGTTNISVSQPTTLAVAATMVPVVCNGGSNGTIQVAGSGGTAPYQYSLDGVNWQSMASFSVPAGSYTIHIKDNNSCMTSTLLTVTEPTVLSAVSVNSNASCNGGNDGRIVVTASGGNSGYRYSIDGGANWQTSNVFNVAPGNYVVQVKDALDCLTSFNTTVELTDDLSITPQSDVTICESKSVQLNLTSNALQYSWLPATGLSNTTISNPVANPVVTTRYIVTATFGRCVAKDTVFVNVNPAPTPNAGPDGFICYGQSYTLQAAGGVQYQWTPPTYLNSTTIPNPISTPSKDITYTLSILADANGCASLVTDQMTIDVTPPLKLKTYPFDTIGYPGDQFQLLAVPNDPDATTFVWTPATRLSSSSIANPIVTVGDVGQDIQYRVIATTQAGCRGEGYVTVRVYKGPDIYVPTGFTPNNDGKNDKFTPFPVGMKSYNYFRVFNRWGQLVFTTTQLNYGWDGRSGGVEQPAGTYVWMIEGVTKDNRLITKKGTVVMIR